MQRREGRVFRFAHLEIVERFRVPFVDDLQQLQDGDRLSENVLKVVCAETITVKN
jgi:hypothetical protein